MFPKGGGMSDTNDRRWTGALARLDANLLVALDALLQEASVTRAARRIGVTQSAMSQTLARLRRQFDDPILAKAGRHMEPTPFGIRIRERLRHALSELEALASDRPVFTPSSASNRFVVATVDYLAAVWLAPLRAAVAERAPSVRLAVHGLDQGSVAAQLGSGHIHLYLGVHGATERGLEAATLYEDPLCVVLDRDHPSASGLNLDQYAAMPHVHVSPRREAGSIVDRTLASRGKSREVVLEVPYFNLVPSLLRETNLVATLPRSLAEHFAQHYPLAMVPAPLSLPSVDVCMAWHPAFAADPALIWLRETLADLVRRS